MRPEAMAQEDPTLRQRVRRSALFWLAVAAAFYFGFIALTLIRGSR